MNLNFKINITEIYDDIDINAIKFWR